MKKLVALILVGGMLLLTGCSKEEAAHDETVDGVASVAQQEVPAGAGEESEAKVSLAAVVEEPEAGGEPLAAAAEEPVVASAEPKPAAERAADKIFFDFDSLLLTAASKEALDGNALWLQAQPEVRIVLEGYTDERGAAQYNLALGQKRAEAARDYLVSLGVAPERISTISFGEEKAAQGAGETAWARDRRVEFVAAN